MRKIRRGMIPAKILTSRLIRRLATLAVSVTRVRSCDHAPIPFSRCCSHDPAARRCLLRDAPSYPAVQGTPSLLWVSNTDSDVFRMALKGRSRSRGSPRDCAGVWLS